MRVVTPPAGHRLFFGVREVAARTETHEVVFFRFNYSSSFVTRASAALRLS